MTRSLCLLLFVSLLWVMPLQSSMPPVSASARVYAQAQLISQRGNATDTVRLLVSLVRTPGARQPLSPLGVQLRKRAVRSAQFSFMNRQSPRFVMYSQQPTLVPIVFGEMRRQDVLMLAQDADVIGIEEDQLMPALVSRSTALIGATTVNSSGFDGTGTAVAVLDTGVLKTHEFLTGKVVAEACFSNYFGNETSLCPSGTNTSTDVAHDAGSAQPCTVNVNCSHGTHVAGIIAGNVKASHRGVAPGANIIAVQVFTYSAGSLGTYSSNQVMAMDWLMTHMHTPEWGQLAAINMSLGSGLYSAACDASSTLTPYINDFRALGVATVVATGNNSNSGAIARPACVSSAIAVGSSTSGTIVRTEDEVSSFSNSVPVNLNAANANGDRLIDLLAPGEVIMSSVSSSNAAYDYKQGTSMAAPHVAGAWAVMKQYAPNASVSEILFWLYRSGDNLIDARNALSLPRINMSRAVRLASTALNATASTTASPTPTTPEVSTTSPTPTTPEVSTASPTPTATEVSTASPTPTATEVSTSSPTPTATAMASASPTPTATRIPTRTRTRTASPTATAIPRPAGFVKRAPFDGMRSRARAITLSWSASVGAQRYEYCIATSGPACTNWRSVGGSRSVMVRGLMRNTTYVWQVRAHNRAGVTIATNGRWRFTTEP